MNHVLISAIALSILAASNAAQAEASLPPEVASLATAWAHANYEITDPGARLAEMQRLADQADAAAKARPGQAEFLVWAAIITGTEAGLKGGMGALGLAKAARDLAQKAEAVNPAALDGSVYTTLGSLYDQVPGFPVGFGDKKKARAYLERALSLNPTGIDANYFYGAYLNGQGEYAKAAKVLETAQHAAPRPGREIADRGRRQEIAALLTQVRRKLPA